MTRPTHYIQQTKRAFSHTAPVPAKHSQRTGSLTLGSTRRGVLRLMKDFMTLLREAKVGVMSIWFFCTVCKNVRSGRTTCRPEPESAKSRQGRHQVRARTCLPCWLDRVGKGSCSVGVAAPHPPDAPRPVHSLPAYSCVSSCPGTGHITKRT